MIMPSSSAFISCFRFYSSFTRERERERERETCREALHVLVVLLLLLLRAVKRSYLVLKRKERLLLLSISDCEK